MRKTSLLLALIFAVMFLTAQLFAGVVYEVETKDHEGSSSETDTMTVSVEGKNLMMNTSKNADNTMIYHGEKREMVVVDHENSTYMVIDKATIEQMGKKMQETVDQSMSQVNEALKNLPPDKRAEIEKMMKEKMPGMSNASTPVPDAAMVK